MKMRMKRAVQYKQAEKTSVDCQSRPKSSHGMRSTTNSAALAHALGTGAGSGGANAGAAAGSCAAAAAAAGASKLSGLGKSIHECFLRPAIPLPPNMEAHCAKN